MNEIGNIEEEGLNSIAVREFKNRIDKKGKQKEIVNGMLNKEGKTVTGKEEKQYLKISIQNYSKLIMKEMM